MNNPAELRVAADLIVARARQWMADHPARMLIAIDGSSGSGKSSVASLVAADLDAALIPGDDFFAAGITDAEWDAQTAEWKAAHCIDWLRLRREALEPLLAGRPAQWHTFDFKAGMRKDGTYALIGDPVGREPKPVIVLDGAYSCRPELSDLVSLSVLVDAPAPVRHNRLAKRESKDFLTLWHARWDTAEEFYFEKVRPAAAFDLVVRNHS